MSDFSYDAFTPTGVIPLPTPQVVGENEMVEEVIVVGERIQRVTRIDPNPGIYERSYNVWNGSGWQPLQPIDQDLLDAAINAGPLNDLTKPEVIVTVPESSPDYAKALNAALLVEKKIDQLHDKIQNLSNAEIITLENGNHLSGFQIKQLWDNFSVKVSNDPMGPGKGGEIVNGVSNVRFDTIYDPSTNRGYYVSAGDIGLSYYVIHEVSHMTGPSQVTHSQNWATYYNLHKSDDPKGEHYYEDPLGKADEAYTNRIYQSIAPFLEQSVWLSAPNGY